MIESSPSTWPELYRLRFREERDERIAIMEESGVPIEAIREAVLEIRGRVWGMVLDSLSAGRDDSGKTTRTA